MNKFTVRAKDGAYSVFKNGTEIESGLNNREAWRAADLLSLEPTSRAQDVSDWVSKKEANHVPV